MKKLVVLFVFFVAFGSLQAQSIFDQWAELKTFHGVMSQTFHPSEEGNLEPIKTRADEMAEKADVLAKSTIPDKFATPAIKKAVEQLQTDSKILAQLVQSKGDDESITKSLNSLHDVFHQIVGLCKDEKHENHPKNGKQDKHENHKKGKKKKE